jgi:hypothetical protein
MRATVEIMRYAYDFIAMLRSDAATREIAVELTCAKITQTMHGTPANMAKLKERAIQTGTAITATNKLLRALYDGVDSVSPSGIDHAEFMASPPGTRGQCLSAEVEMEHSLSIRFQDAILGDILCGAEKSRLTAHPTMKKPWAEVDKLQREAIASRKAPVSEATPIGGAGANHHITEVSSLPINPLRMS